jgi:tetratricopeptide (TPR) repeat protein
VTAETPLVGRETELATLRRVMDEAWSGRRQVVAILGEAGIGKSRLIDELAAEALKRGGAVLLGRAHESEQILPFGVWADALRQGQLLGDAEVIAGLAPARRAELARLFPEMAEPGLPHSSENWGYLRLFEAMVDCVERLAARHPLLLVLEDVHWADQLSLRLLSFLGRRVGVSQVLVVGTAREEELADALVLRQVLEELRREERLVELTLPALSQPETVSLVRTLAKAGTDEAVVARLGEQIWRASEGNPFMIVETVRALEEKGLARAPAVPPLPQRVHRVIAERLERLSKPSRELASVAAVVGREFDFALLPRAAAGDEHAIAEGIEELMRRHVLRSVGERFEFRHERIREVAVAELLPPRRKLLHAAVARALETTYAANLEPYYVALAAHYCAGEIWDKAVEYLVRFGRKAARVYAHAEAVRAFEEALRHLERLPVEQQDARRVDVVPRLARALTFLGRFQDALDLLLGQQVRVEALGQPWVTGRYNLLLAHTDTFNGDRDCADRTARRAAEEARRCGDDATVGRALYVLAMEGYWSGRPTEGIEYGQEAVALLERTAERWWLGQSHFSMAANYVLMGDFAPALEAATRAYAIGEALRDPRVQTPAGWLTGVIHAMRGDPEQGIEVCQRALDLSPDPLNTADALGWMGYAYLEKGDAATAIRHLEQSVEQWSGFRLRPAQGGFLTLLGEAYLADGQLERAIERADQGFQLTTETRYLLGVGWGRRLFGRIARCRGRLPEAETHFDQACETFASIQARFELARTHLALADLAHARASPERVATHLGEARSLFMTLGLPKWVARSEQAAQRFGVAPPTTAPGCAPTA